jgi:hypothetical protein
MVWFGGEVIDVAPTLLLVAHPVCVSKQTVCQLIESHDTWSEFKFVRSGAV